MHSEQLIIGHCYFDITYPDATLTRPIISSYEYVGEGKLESESEGSGKHYLFKFHPKYKSDDPDAIENGLIVYTISQLESLIDIVELSTVLESIHAKLKKTHS